MKMQGFSSAVTLVVVAAIVTAVASSQEHSLKNFTDIKEGGCYVTKCSDYVYCYYDYKELRVDKRACPGGQERKLCCKQTSGCIDTLCEAFTPRCPSGTNELTRDQVICDSNAPVMTTLHCCNQGFNPQCFNTSCSTGGGDPCPKGYEEAASGSGAEWGCPHGGQWTYNKKTCCLSPKNEDEDTGSNGAMMTINNFLNILALLGLAILFSDSASPNGITVHK